MFLSFSGDLLILQKLATANGMKIENSMKECLTKFSWVFWVLSLFITMFIDWIIKRFTEVLEVGKTNDIQIFGNKHIIFVD